MVNIKDIVFYVEKLKQKGVNEEYTFFRLRSGAMGGHFGNPFDMGEFIGEGMIISDVLDRDVESEVNIGFDDTPPSEWEYGGFPTSSSRLTERELKELRAGLLVGCARIEELYASRWHKGSKRRGKLLQAAGILRDFVDRGQEAIAEAVGDYISEGLDDGSIQL